MHIIINNASMVPIYEQIGDQIKKLIISGSLKENDPLPSVRALSGELRISALTVKKVYDRLEEEGYVITIHGKGTYISPMNTAIAAESRLKAAEDELAAAIEKSRALGLKNAEIRSVIEILLEE